MVDLDVADNLLVAAWTFVGCFTAGAAFVGVAVVLEGAAFDGEKIFALRLDCWSSGKPFNLSTKF